MSGSANVWIGKCLDIGIGKYLDRQMSGSANDYIESANVRSANVLVCICPFGKSWSADVDRQKSATTMSVHQRGLLYTTEQTTRVGYLKLGKNTPWSYLIRYWSFIVFGVKICLVVYYQPVDNYFLLNLPPHLFENLKQFLENVMFHVFVNVNKSFYHVPILFK